ncbi:hypothetical protein NUU61_002387 [Penicillium alfredii]|uniref:Indoleamine 2,3-dioxygenase n=1 Tax=Penicillium alfredii TaxID=1506179 RepID=A0A9W9FRH8_9EURO|nr:uncharacterized protein NUU61_002387 [Penicillium alfredii]KAJ5105040.1 hypothetical protein NUU61_002387 [Penicillium alfredii]
MFAIYILAILAAVYAILTRLPAIRKKLQQIQLVPEQQHVPITSEDAYILRAKTLKSDHATVISFQTLIETDGAGSWPPRAEHGPQWPSPLRPYHEIYRTLCSSLPCTANLDDDEANVCRCTEFRSRMAKLLRSHIDLTAVDSVLRGSTQETEMSPAAWNGFLSCIAYSRHAFRWATIPIVKVTQATKFIELPPELEVAWGFLCDRYQIHSPGGCIMSNHFGNFTDTGELVYKINEGMPDIVQRTEYNFMYSFVMMEKLSFPIYLHIVESITLFDKGEKAQCFYQTFITAKVSERVWLNHVQGFQGWAAGRIEHGEYVQYDGVQGGQTLMMQVVDAFLGMDAFLTKEASHRNVPYYQREFVETIRRYAFRHRALKAGDQDIEQNMESISRIVQIFRISHRRTARKYLGADAPERKFMTSGESVFQDFKGEAARKDPLDHVDSLLTKRLNETKRSSRLCAERKEPIGPRDDGG